MYVLILFKNESPIISDGKGKPILYQINIKRKDVNSINKMSVRPPAGLRHFCTHVSNPRPSPIFAAAIKFLEHDQQKKYPGESDADPV